MFKEELIIKRLSGLLLIGLVVNSLAIGTEDIESKIRRKEEELKKAYRYETWIATETTGPIRILRKKVPRFYGADPENLKMWEDIVDDKILFYDKKGRIIKEIDADRIDLEDKFTEEQKKEIEDVKKSSGFPYAEKRYDYRLSEKGNILLETQKIYYGPEDRGYAYGWEDITKIYDKKGNCIGGIGKWRSPLYISPDEKYIVALGYIGGEDEWTGTISVHKINGEIIKECGDYWLTHIEVCFSEDSKYFVVYSGGRIFLFNNQGDLLWRYSPFPPDRDESIGQIYQISSKNSFFICESSKGIFIIYKHKEKWQMKKEDSNPR